MKPQLFVFAGPNGSGKSFYSDFYLQNKSVSLISYDYDLEMYAKWKKYAYDPVVESGIRTLTSQEFETKINHVVSNKEHFSFQTNFNDESVIKIIEKFKKGNYEISIHFYFVDNIKTLRDRVDYRHKYLGLHHVDTPTITERYHKGIELLNKHHSIFTKVVIYDNSILFNDPLLELLPSVAYIRDKNEIDIAENCSSILKTQLPFVLQKKIDFIDNNTSISKEIELSEEFDIIKLKVLATHKDHLEGYSEKWMNTLIYTENKNDLSFYKYGDRIEVIFKKKSMIQKGIVRSITATNIKQLS